MANREFEKVFQRLGHTEKTQFINEKIEYASEKTVAEYVEMYPLGVFKHISSSLLVTILEKRGYKVKAKDNGTTGN